MRALGPAVDQDEQLLDLAPREDRADMIARQARMSVDERVDLFERLSRDAAWVRACAKRIR